MQLCECTDHGCREHKGEGCNQYMTTEEGLILYRVDMEDFTGTWMCNPCADDAMATKAMGKQRRGGKMRGFSADYIEQATLETHEDGKVRILVLPDEHADYDNLTGDMFDPKHNPGVDPEQLALDEKNFQERLNRDGVWGIVGEYYNGETWECADSCWGFVGDDVKTSGYLEDIRDATIKAYREQQHCLTCGRPQP